MSTRALPAPPAGYALEGGDTLPAAGAKTFNTGMSAPPAGYKLEGSPSATGGAKQGTTLSRAAGAFWDGIGGSAITNVVKALGGDKDAADQTVQSVKDLVNGLAGEPARVWSELSDSGRAMIAGHLADATYHLAGAVPLVGAGAQRVAQDADQGDYAEAAGHAAALILPFAIGAAPEDLGATAMKTPAAVAAAVKEGGPQVATGAAKIGAGLAMKHIPGIGYAGFIPIYKGIRDVVNGVKAGVEAGKSAITDAPAPAVESAAASGTQVPRFTQTRPAPAAAPAEAAAATPGMAGPAITPAAGSTEPSVFSEMPQAPPAVLPRPPGEVPIIPAGPEAAPVVEDTGLLDGLAQSLGGRKFAKLAPPQQQMVRDVAARIQSGVEDEPASTPPASSGSNADPRAAGLPAQPRVSPLGPRPTPPILPRPSSAVLPGLASATPEEQAAAAFAPDQAKIDAATAARQARAETAHSARRDAWANEMAQRLYQNGKGLMPPDAQKLDAPVLDQIAGARSKSAGPLTPASKMSPDTLLSMHTRLWDLWNAGQSRN